MLKYVFARARYTTRHHAVSRPVHMRQSSRTMTTSTYERLDPSIPVEEETLDGYRAESYYPVVLGAVFHERYKTLGKLGYGSASTVWFCEDVRKQNEYVALKVYVDDSKNHRELAIYEHINSLESEHHGRNDVRKLLDSFEISGPHGKHICLVHQPKGVSLYEFRARARRHMPKWVIPAGAVREFMRPVLTGLQIPERRSQSNPHGWVILILHNYTALADHMFQIFSPTTC